MMDSDININKSIIKQMFCADKNLDFKIRDFKVEFKNQTSDAFLVFFDGMTNQSFLNRDIMRALLSCKAFEVTDASKKDIVFEQIITVAPLSINESYDTVGEMVSFGECAIFVDGCACCFMADVKGWETRSVQPPTQEVSLAGPQESFTESIMTNLALVRKILKNPKLIAKKIAVGNTNKIPCAVMYIDGIANDGILNEVMRRLSGIDTEYIFSSSDVEMLIEDETFLPLPGMLKTERPDRVASMLADGKIAVIVQGSPFVLIVPTTTLDLIEATEDNYVRVSEANLMRAVRLFGMSISILLPGLFVAVMLYHQEIFPTDLLVSISASRESLPFSLIVELILMEIAFELIKEASVRVPSPIGSTLGIIGGLILGQSAVEAGIVSPLLIIIVSIGGIGAFSTPTIPLSRSLSVLKFIYIFAAYMFGVLGLTAAVLISLSILASAKTFGVPFLTERDGSESIFVKPIWKKEKRPQSIKPKDLFKQPRISRKWKER